MAEIFHVVYNAQHAGGGALPPLPGLGATTAGTGTGGDGRVEYSAEEVEKMTQVPGNETPKRFGTEKIVAHGPIQVAKIATIEASSAENAAKFVKYVINAEVLGVVSPFAGKAKTTEAAPTNKEAGEKPIQTVKAAELAITAAV